MNTHRSILATIVALALTAGLGACDPGSDTPETTTTSGDEKPEIRTDDDEGLIDDQTFDDEEGLVDDEEGVVPDDTFGDEGIIDDNP
ncbi:hypothetical protein [Sandaracinus amylolyticus]|uniref:hypothetical protein n=1 Tax=Sandaracinus amylolyticus TaxID=927083 RepID=UPI001F4866F6|nr:hypothetical protein [Sandaracinus amylolyticus]UJR87002.1 Hypothetical protein I5071_91030 [Sandaracinus amylolyticus]